MNQPVLSLLPAEARSVGPSAGLVEGPAGGVVFVFGLATFTWPVGDETGRRLAAVQLLQTKVASAVEVASAFAVTTVTLWRWVQSFTEAGVSGLVRARSGPKGPTKLTEPLKARIVELDAQGLTLRQIAARTEVSTATVRVALGRVAPRAAQPVEPAVTVADSEVLTPVVHDELDLDHGHDDERDDDAATVAAELTVLPSPLPRTAERAAARSGDLIEAPVVITQGRAAAVGRSAAGVAGAGDDRAARGRRADPSPDA